MQLRYGRILAFAWGLGLALPAQALEQVVRPVATDADMGRVVNQTLTRNALTQANCLNQVAKNSVKTCPEDCMLSIRKNGITSVNLCDSVDTTEWVCEWPKTWIERNLSCQQVANITGAGAGWSGPTIPTRRQYELRKCNTEVVYLGKLEILGPNQCIRKVPEYRNDPCPAGLEGTDIYVRYHDHIMTDTGKSEPTGTISDWSSYSYACYPPPPPPPPSWWPGGGWGGGGGADGVGTGGCSACADQMTFTGDTTCGFSGGDVF